MGFLERKGKSFRPTICMLMSLATSGRISPQQAQLAEITELIHTASLIHNDVLEELDEGDAGNVVHRMYSTPQGNKVSVGRRLSAGPGRSGAGQAGCGAGSGDHGNGPGLHCTRRHNDGGGHKAGAGGSPTLPPAGEEQGCLPDRVKLSVSCHPGGPG